MPVLRRVKELRVLFPKAGGISPELIGGCICTAQRTAEASCALQAGAALFLWCIYM